MALIMPAIAVLIGLGLVALAIRRLRHAPVAPPVASPKKLDPQALARYKEQIDRDLAQMD